MRGNRLIVVLALLFVLLAGGAGVWWVVNSEPVPAEPEKPKKVRPPRTPGSRSRERETLTPLPPVTPGSAIPTTNGGDAPGGGTPIADEPVVEEPKGPPPADVRGTIRDPDGNPVAGARVLYVVMNADGSEAGYTVGATTERDGAFVFEPSRWKAQGTIPESVNLKGRTGQVRIRAAGFQDWIGAVYDGTLDLRLDRRDGAPLPGTLRGTVLAKDDTPYEGRVQIDGIDAFGATMQQWTEAGTGGAFALPGIPPGTWRVRVGEGERRAVEVVENSDVWVTLKAGDGDVSGGKPRSDTDRHVVVELPADAEGATTARAESSARQFWRVLVNGTRVEFTHLPVGAYTLVLESPGKPERTMSLDVVAGEGEQFVTFGK